jgi:hypothetical protein
MKLNARSIGKHLASLAWVALRSFLGTVIVLAIAGVVLAAMSYYFLREQDWLYRGIAVVVALVEAMVTGIILGGKRAVAMAVAHGLGSLRLGQSLVRVVFERMLGVAEGETFGERGGRITQSVERMPLAQADELLSNAVRQVTGEVEPSKGLRGKIQVRLLEAVRKYTLGRFREEGATHDGVNLLKVRDELEQTIDDALIQKVRGGLRLWTVLVIIGLPVVVATQTWIVLMTLRSTG